MRFLSWLQGRIGEDLVPASPLTFSFTSYIRQRPMVFAAWVHLRRLKYALVANFNRGVMRFAETGGEASTDYIRSRVVPHNVEMLSTIKRKRTERLMNVLRTVRGLDVKKAKVLCIGPRNEAEILLLSLYGFSLQNIIGIDLFSYSPLIRTMDMHDMRFPDSQFDVVYSSYVISYSEEPSRFCAEMLRVVKDSGLIALAFVKATEETRTQTPRTFHGDLSEVFGYFGHHLGPVYWQESDGAHMSTIFRVRKPVKQ